MAKYLRLLCIEPIIYANKGKAHGVTEENLEKILEDKVDTLIIVDSLDGSIDNYKVLYDNNVTVLVCDHHFISPDIPYSDYVTLVSSQDNYGNPALCGAGVTLKVIMAVDERLGTFDSYEFFDLAAAGLCADMMDLSEDYMENRALVNYGLQNVNNVTLQKIAKTSEFNSKTIAFSIAPKVNCAMRLSQNEYANNAFLTENETDISKYVKLLNKCREEQNAEVDRIFDDAIEQCENQKDKQMLIVVIDSKYSINGLLGNRLLSLYMKPILVLTERYGSYQGSMRACGVEDFRQMLEDTGLCEAKGHESASGIEIPYCNFDKFREVMEDKLSHIEFSQAIDIDAQIDICDVDDMLIKKVKEIDRISGQGFPPLKFLIEVDDFHVEKVSNGKHLCIRTPSMLFIKWNFNDDEMYELLEEAELLGDPIKCIGSLDGSFVYKVFNKMILDDIILD